MCVLQCTVHVLADVLAEQKQDEFVIAFYL